MRLRDCDTIEPEQNLVESTEPRLGFRALHENKLPENSIKHINSSIFANESD